MERPSKNAATEIPREAPDRVTLEWAVEHLNMSTALEAYRRGVLFDDFGETRIAGSAENVAQVEAMVSEIKREEGVEFSLSDEEIYQTLAWFRPDWLDVAALKTVEIRRPEYFVLKEYDGSYFPAGVEGHNGERYYRDSDRHKLTKTFYEDRNLIPPDNASQYAPGQYLGSTQTMLLWEEPDSVKERLSEPIYEPARRQYARELILHEFLHSVLRQDAKHTFVIDGMEKNYATVMREFYDICQREPVSTSVYSELYLPFRTRDFDLNDFWLRSYLQEELGETCSSYILGWGTNPQGEPVRLQDRDFGGESFGKTGKSEKYVFVEKLLNAPTVRRDVNVFVPLACTLPEERVAEMIGVVCDSVKGQMEIESEVITGGVRFPVTEAEMSVLKGRVESLLSERDYPLIVSSRVVGTMPGGAGLKGEKIEE